MTGDNRPLKVLHVAETSQGGVGSYLESLVVRQQLLEAEQRMASLKAEQVDTSVQLIQALGGGFRPAADDQSVVTAAPATP